MSAGGNSGSSDTRFERKGTASTTSFRDLTPEHKSLFQTGINASDPTGSGAVVQNHIDNTLNYDQTTNPFTSELGQIVQANLPGTEVPGQASLTQQAAVDPYSSDYGDDTFDRYNRDLGTSLSQVSGPLATRGGTAAQGFMAQELMSGAALNREDVLTQNRRADAGIQQGAAQGLHNMQGRDTGEALQAIGQGQGDWQNLVSNQNTAAGLGNQRAGVFSDLVQSYTNLDAVVKGEESNDLTGRGAQSSSSAGANMSVCCFIFMEAYNGELPWFVRASRDLHAPECSDRREGYISMAKWLVPAMRVSKIARWLTNKLMIQPLSKYGGYEWTEEGYDNGWVYKPVVNFWFTTWKLIGKLNRK